MMKTKHNSALPWLWAGIALAFCWQPMGCARQAASEEKQHMVRVHVFDRYGKLVGPVDSPRVTLSEAEWRKRLTPQQYDILRSQDTERPFCGTLLDNKKEGVYCCAGCGLALFL